MKTKVAMAMSGGVDSSVAAYVLKKEGYEVSGVFMHCWPQTGWPCTEDRDRADAIKVAEKLKIPFLVWDFEKEYRERVMDYFYREYKAGRTPNPDSYCNREIKFGLFLERALKELNVDFIATGHYARIRADRDGYELLKGVDDKKDQSYFLYTLGQYELSKTLFPVGGMLKSEVRELAKKIGLSNFDKKGTSGICFIGKVDIRDFLKKEIKEKEGNVLDLEGNVIGKHKGVWFYTIGQRHGFTLNGKRKWEGLPLYVVSKNIKKNELVVGWGEETEKKSFFVDEVHWINESFNNCGVRIRHQGEIYKCKVKVDNKVLVELEEGVRGISSGQNAVFYSARNKLAYDKEICLGGGVIE